MTNVLKLLELFLAHLSVLFAQVFDLCENVSVELLLTVLATTIYLYVWGKHVCVVVFQDIPKLMVMVLPMRVSCVTALKHAKLVLLHKEFTRNLACVSHEIGELFLVA